MNKISTFTLKALRKLYSKVMFTSSQLNTVCEQNPNIASKLIYEKLNAEQPCMIGRYGSTELTCIVNYIGVNIEKKQVLNYIIGKTNPWWWEKKILNQMQQWSGFFPPTVEKIEQFCELMLEDTKELDILGSWLPIENILNTTLNEKIKINLKYIEPFHGLEPWTRVLKGKKVLVIHPFSETIKNQYNNREFLFENKDILPEFELFVIKAVQSIAGEKTKFESWFEALENMKQQMDNIEYDICLIGAGAYGFPLAAHAKRQRKKAIHMGGVLQVLFGIKGNRFDKLFENYYNKYWIRPTKDETPKNAKNVEDACYW